MASTKHNAIWITGPTGVGKTPLGKLLEKKGLHGKRILHFDFGEALRTSVMPQVVFFSAKEKEFIQSVLKSGALLEKNNFYLAEKLINGFLNDKKKPFDFILLNGIPRHLQQSFDVENLFEIKIVINLKCTPASVFSRISTNVGGDRRKRDDDAYSLVCKKLMIYEKRTTPLFDRYGKMNIPVCDILVEKTTSSEENYNILEKWWSDLNIKRKMI